MACAPPRPTSTTSSSRATRSFTGSTTRSARSWITSTSWRSSLRRQEYSNVPIAVDDYILDSLMRDLVAHDGKPSAFLVYLYLWRLTVGQGRAAVHQTHQQLADSTPLPTTSLPPPIPP